MRHLRRWSLPLLAAAVAAVLAGCGGGDSGGGSGAAKADFPTGRTIPKGPVKLTMWWWGEQEAKGAKEWLAQTVDAYHAKHPNVTITTVLQSTDSLVPAFKTAASAKKGPDIQFFWGGIWSLENAWSGAIRPVSDYLGRAEVRHYLNAGEDTYAGKVWTAPWYAQPSFPLLYRKDVLAKAGVQPPQTWPELLSACDALRAKGVTPMAGGLKDGFFAGWLYSMLGVQNVQASDVLAAVGGEQSFADPKHAAWWQRLQELRDRKCFNDDINSLELYRGQQLWTDGKAAMTITAGSDVRKFVQDVGVGRVGVSTMPRWGSGPNAGRLGGTSQTLGITSTTRYPQVAADFIRFTHTPERMNAFFEATGALPADDRFDQAQIKLPQQQFLAEQLRRPAPYLENFIPTELDSKAVFEQTQLLFSGKEDAKAAAARMEDVAARIRRVDPDQVSNFKAWGESYR
jgi:raffinose/stachyose/melibiose transport system substrate-binding protein